jgi:hypothetical protein
VDSQQGWIHFDISYHDGTTIHATEVYVKENGYWRHTISKTLEAVAPEWKGGTRALPEAYTDVQGTGASLRLPDGCRWDAAKERYTHPKLGLTIDVHFNVGILEDYLISSESVWKDPALTLQHRQDLTVGKAQGKYYEGATRASDNGGKHLLLVAGQDGKTLWISATFPDDARVAELAKHCLLTAQWDPEAGTSPATKLAFRLTAPAKLQLIGVQLDGEMPQAMYRDQGRSRASRGWRRSACSTPARRPP